MSEATVGWLIAAAAVLTAVVGIGTRVLIGRNRHRPVVQRAVRGIRDRRMGRILFGHSPNDALDDDELDQMVLMPTIVIACGLTVTAVFMMGYNLLI